MEIKKVTADKKQYLSLLLLADEQEDMIDRYLDKGDMYILMDDGVKVLGYLHWSLLDNWEWGTYVPTFGLASVDHTTYQRKLKPSAYFYGDITKNGKMTKEIIRKHYNHL